MLTLDRRKKHQVCPTSFLYTYSYCVVCYIRLPTNILVCLLMLVAWKTCTSHRHISRATLKKGRRWYLFNFINHFLKFSRHTMEQLYATISCILRYIKVVIPMCTCRWHIQIDGTKWQHNASLNIHESFCVFITINQWPIRINNWVCVCLVLCQK